MLNLARHFSEIPGNSLRCKHNPVMDRFPNRQITAIPTVFFPSLCCMLPLEKIAPHTPMPRTQASIPNRWPEEFWPKHREIYGVV